MKTISIACAACLLILRTQTASADPGELEPTPGAPLDAKDRAASTAPAFEVNVLWPFFPGGIVDFKVLTPLLRAERDTFRGELVLGLHSDFAWRYVREDEAKYGQVAFYGVKVGWRQFFAYGLHLDVSVNTGYRYEKQSPLDGRDIHAAQARFWGFAGYQHDLSDSVYFNVRGGVGVHVFRTDRFASEERFLTGGGDLNLGFRLW